VLANGWYGAGNVGDELLLRMLIQWCEEAGARVSALSPFPHHTRIMHRIDAVDAFDLPAVARTMLESDLFVLGGGGLFQTHHSFTIPGLYEYRPGDIASYARPLLMARQMGVPTVLWAHGVGPLDGEQARAIVRDAFSHASHASVRDNVSSALLREIGVDREIPVAPDPVWALPVDRSAPARTTGKRRLGLVLREWSSVSGWEDAFMAALREVVSPQEYLLVWMPFEAGEAGSSGADAALMEYMISNLGEYEHETIIPYDPGNVLDALRGCDFNVCMRLHAQILSLKLARPTMCVEYDSKMSRVSEMIGLPSSMRLVPSAPLPAWRDTLRALLASDAPASMDRVLVLEEQALVHKRVLHAAIDASRSRSGGMHWDAGAFDWVRAWTDSAVHDAFAKREGYLAAQVVRRDGWLAASSNKVVSLNDELRRSERTVVDAEAAVARTEAELTAQRAQVATLQREIQAYSERVAGLREEVARRQGAEFDYRKEVESRIAIADALMREVSQLNTERETIERERARLEGLVIERTNERNSMLASRSWAVTRPLRVARALLASPSQERNWLIYRLLRSAYRALPEALRARLGGARETFVEHARVVMEPASAEPGLDWVTLANEAEKVAIVPCAFEFDELANQRPINLAKYLANRGYTVMFAAWQWSRDERLSKSNREVLPGIWQIDLYSLMDQAANLNCRTDSRSAYFITLPAPDLVNLHSVMRKCGMAVVYDMLDEWEAFNSVGQAPWYSAAHEHEAVMASDVVSAVSPPLVAKFSHLRTDMHVIGNGYTPATLGLDNRFCAAAARKTGGPTRIGYFGHLTDAWFDWGVVLDAARQLPHCEFEIIGYGEPQWVRDAAETLFNLKLVGKVPPSELWKYAQHWHVGLAPFKPGPLAVAIDPIKVYEYIYLGLPTVCTGIPHLGELPGVTVVEGVEAFVEACRNNIDMVPDYAAMTSCLQGTTWEARFDALLHAVDAEGLRGMYVA